MSKRHKSCLAIAIALVLSFASPAFADSESEGETRLKGRGWGRGVAVFYNGLPKESKRLVNGTFIAVVCAAAGYGILRFYRQTRESLATRVREPWETGPTPPAAS